MGVISELLFLLLSYLICMSAQIEQKHPPEAQNAGGASNRHSKLPNKRLVSTQRCFVVCPIQVLCLNHASSDNSPNYENETSTSNSGIGGHINVTKIPILQNTAETKNVKKETKYEYHSHEELNFNHPSLNKIWQQKLLIGLKSSNQNGKQSYKFRQFLPENCHVICTRRQPLGPGPVVHPSTPGPVVHPLTPGQVNKTTQIPSHGSSGKPGSLKPGVTQASQTTSTEESDDNDDGYEEGEDQPIEATISPPSGGEDKKSKHTKVKKLTPLNRGYN